MSTWETALWPDNSLKWTGHAIPASANTADEFTLKATTSTSPKQPSGIVITNAGGDTRVNTGKIIATFPKGGNVIVRSIEANGKVVGKNGKLILRSQSAPEDGTSQRKDSSSQYFTYEGRIDSITVENKGVRALITTRGKHEVKKGGDHAAWLAFTVRFYLYENSEAIRVVHTIVYDGEAQKDFIAGLGITFEIPLKGEEFYNRRKSFQVALSRKMTILNSILLTSEP